MFSVDETGASLIPNGGSIISFLRSSKMGKEEVIEGSTDQCAESVEITLDSSFSGYIGSSFSLGICRRLRKEEEVSSGDARKLYEVICEEFSMKPRSYTTFWKHLKALEREGLLEARSTNTSVGRGRTTYITMTNTAPATIGSRIEEEFTKR